MNSFKTSDPMLCQLMVRVQMSSCGYFVLSRSSIVQFSILRLVELSKNDGMVQRRSGSNFDLISEEVGQRRAAFLAGQAAPSRLCTLRTQEQDQRRTE